MKTTNIPQGHILIFAKAGDVTVDGEGNIHFYIKKDKPETTEITVRKLRRLIGENITMDISRFYKKEEELQSEETQESIELHSTEAVQSISI